MNSPNTDSPIVFLTIAVWVILELALVVRDKVRGTGSTLQDRGTCRLIALVTAASFVMTQCLELVGPNRTLLGIQGDAPVAVGVILMWSGLLLRMWAILTLGTEFRTTVEVTRHQQLVESGPYRLLRHPAYTGVLLLTTGYGVTSGVWPALAISIAGPTAVFIRRIRVEEQALVTVMGETYVDYKRRTRALIPYVW